METREQKRLEEIKKREERINNMLSKMGDVNHNKDKDLERKQEREYIKQCIEKDEQAALQDLNKKL